jgi:signal transduction histidine kinase
MADPELAQLRERIQALQIELAKHRHSAEVLETTETNLHLFARGLAHDFNNLLTGILGHAALIQSAADVGEESRDAAGVIYKAAERATELVGQLMNFTRGGIGRAMAVDVHDAVREVAELLRRSLEPDIQFVLDPILFT